MKEDKRKYADVETAASLLKNSGASDFEEAISATKFGKFNLLLILIAIPSGWSSIFETTTMSYVFPAAQCDLNLSLGDKGLLNAVTYIGMISSAFVWGYLCDTLGRKKLLYIGFFLDTLFVLMSSLSQTFTLLMVSKFLGGFIINGPFAALTCYLSEFHCAKYRARVQMVLGIIFSAGTICLPLLAAVILPEEIDVVLFGYFRMHSWNILLLVSSVPPLLGGIVFFFLPESPKFLMSIGRNEEAMKVMQKVYTLNTGKPAETYPIKKLIEERKPKENDAEVEVVETNSKKTFSRGFSQVKPLFIPPLLQKILLVCLLQMMQMMSLNTLRLWLPQLFQAINDYEYYNNGTSADLCTMLETIRPKNVTTSGECVVNTNIKVYVNAMIVSTVTLLGYIVAGSLINYLGKKKLIFIMGMASGLSGYGMYFAQSSGVTLAIASIFIGLGSISINVILSVVVDLFPTSLRTMTVSVTMMSGRMGAMSGNLVFPSLLKLGCAPPFFTVGTGMLGVAIVSLLLPNTDMKSLQ
ncbi:synaptic vesicle glycoprotein 2B-like isoform X2 [Coccinella septempunctata]|uniref:synaptic vesicle glycoprotein 2B-like isoform X2 n=1 Tax=Coccinella septempunctata TaxID=41139 RepID=UPI001D0817DC|nr:synaptic vesicle glycoprotein 2B-like isoform X2 [Coccinella septempunctata]